MMGSKNAMVCCLPFAGLLCCAGILSAETVQETWSVSKRGAHPETVHIEARQITIDLQDLPAGAKLHSAWLVASRDPTDGTMDEALAPVEILANANGIEQRLELWPPWYDRFDATIAASLPGW